MRRSPILLAVVFVVLNTLGANCAQQQKESPAPAREPDAPARDTAAEAQALAQGFFDFVVADLERYTDANPFFADFAASRKLALDPDNMVFEMSLSADTGGDGVKQSAGNGTYGITLILATPDQAPDTDNVVHRRSFPDSDLIFVVREDSPGYGSPLDLENRISDYDFYLIAHNKAMAADIDNAASPMVQGIYDALVALEKTGRYPALDGFAQGATLRKDPEKLSYGVFFAKELGQATMGDPTGKLLNENSCVISFHIGQYIRMMSRWQGGQVEHRDNALENLELEMSWTLDAMDADMMVAIFKDIIEPRIQPLFDVNARYAPAAKQGLGGPDR